MSAASAFIDIFNCVRCHAVSRGIVTHSVQKRPQPQQKHSAGCHNRRRPYNRCEATAAASQYLPCYKAAFCKRLLCGTLGRHDEVDLATKDVKEGDLLRQAFASVRWV